MVARAEHHFERHVGYDTQSYETRSRGCRRATSRRGSRAWGWCRATTERDGLGSYDGLGDGCAIAGGDLATPRIEGRLAEPVLAAKVPDVQAGRDPRRELRTPELFELRVSQMWSRHSGHSGEMPHRNPLRKNCVWPDAYGTDTISTNPGVTLFGEKLVSLVAANCTTIRRQV